MVSPLAQLVALLRAHDVPFRVTGGLAARAYGATRPLADIDVDVPEAAIARLLPAIRPNVIWGPGRYQDAEWDLLLCTFVIDGQEIDLCGAETARYRERATGRWHLDPVDWAEVEHHTLLGVEVPVVPRARLLAYKRRLAREVDLLDVAALEAAGAPTKRE